LLKVHRAALLLIRLHLQFGQLLPQPFLHRQPKPLLARLRIHQDHQVSSPREFRPEALSEPYMNLSAHTAPTMEPRRTPICQCANNRESRRDIRAIQCVALRR
jgi:hypothetical protein